LTVGWPGDYWDQQPEKREFHHPIDLDLLRSFVGHDARILDVGCGYGRILSVLRGAGFTNLLGLDTSRGMIERAGREQPDGQFRHIVGFDTGEPACSADAILLFAVLTCIPSNHDQVALLSECQRVLRSGGILYVSDLYLNKDARNAARYDRFEKRFGVRGIFQLDDGGIMRHHEEAWIETLLADFQPLHQEQFSARTMNNHFSRAFQYIGRKLQ